MWKMLWQKWTIDKPAILGDWLWHVLVVQLAAFLDRLTVRRAIAFIPGIILVLAYCHSIPIPPELMLLGDLLAYIDIFSVLFLLGILSRAATILFITRQVAASVGRLASSIITKAQRLDFRQRREHRTKGRKVDSVAGPQMTMTIRSSWAASHGPSGILFAAPGTATYEFTRMSMASLRKPRSASVSKGLRRIGKFGGAVCAASLYPVVRMTGKSG